MRMQPETGAPACSASQFLADWLGGRGRSLSPMNRVAAAVKQRLNVEAGGQRKDQPRLHRPGYEVQGEGEKLRSPVDHERVAD